MNTEKSEDDATASDDSASNVAEKVTKKPSKKRKKKVKRKRKTKKKRASKKSEEGKGPVAKFPRHSLAKALRVPRAILEQNAGQECSEKEAASFVGVGYAGPFRVEVSSALKYGLMQRPSTGRVQITERARKILRPQKPEDELTGLREAALDAPDLSDVYQHYRGENLPDQHFFRNALTDKFRIPQDKVTEFETVFTETMKDASLIEEHGGKLRLIDVSGDEPDEKGEKRIRKLGRNVDVRSTDTCFVMMPFGVPTGGYYSSIYEPAIQKAGLTPVRADADIFGTGKIIDQIWRGITSASVLVAELTNRNPNVFYELGLAHALNKPVVLVSSNEEDVPFDLQHIRVIYYDYTDPFWGNKLIEKVAENVLSALRNPEEALFAAALQAEM